MHFQNHKCSKFFFYKEKIVLVLILKIMFLLNILNNQINKQQFQLTRTVIMLHRNIKSNNLFDTINVR